MSRHPNQRISLPLAGLVEVRGGRRFWTGNVVMRHDRLDQPRHWKEPRMIFVPSLGDLFHEAVTDDFLTKVFGVMEDCQRHKFQVLTKRPERMRDFLAAYTGTWPLPNVWLGVSIEDRQNLWRMDVLRSTPAAVRFISFEPLLEDLGALDLSGIHWSIVGGESGSRARPCDPEWLRSIVQQSQGALRSPPDCFQ
jgi:protein gp37